MDYHDNFNHALEDFDVEGFLEKSQNREQERIEQELERINQQLEERDQIHQELIDELESKLDWYQERLQRLYKQKRGRNGKRTRFKNKIDGFYEEIRSEKQSFWQDKQQLKKERRKLLRELEEVDQSFTGIL